MPETIWHKMRVAYLTVYMWIKAELRRRAKEGK